VLISRFQGSSTHITSHIANASFRLRKMEVDDPIHASRRVVYSLSSQRTTVAFTPSRNTNCTTAGDFRSCRMETHSLGSLSRVRSSASASARATGRASSRVPPSSSSMARSSWVWAKLATKWSSRLSLVRTRLSILRDRKDCCCSQSCNGYRQRSACETPAPRATLTWFFAARAASVFDLLGPQESAGQHTSAD